MSLPNREAQAAIEMLRSGDLAGAISAAERGAEISPDDAGLRMFLGMLLAQDMQLEGSIDQFKRAIELAPNDMLPRLEVARLLIGLDRVNEAETALRDVLPGPARQKLEALIYRKRGDHRRAAGIYSAAVKADERDFESWGNLGVCLLSMGRPKDAADALAHSLRLRRDQQPIRDKWAEAEVAAGSGEQGLARAYSFARDNPRDTLVWTVIARLEVLLERPEKARSALEHCLERDPSNIPALLALADLNERENRVQDLALVLDRLDRLGVAPSQVLLLKARLAFRRGEFQAALAAARDAPTGADPGSKAQLIGLIQDRIDDPQNAFAAFEAMNRVTANEVTNAPGAASRFRDRIADRATLATRQWVRGWRRAPVAEDRTAPAFMIGFPRSGTTLLDTLLMGHPDVAVAEEKPMLGEVMEAMGGYARLADLQPTEIETLRALYFARVETHVAPRRGQQVIDKLPLGIIHIPVIHRLFPDARFIFVQRHPCDVVLSGFMTRFHPVDGMTNFLTLEDTARLYDRVMDFWRRCRAVLPLLVHVVRYERLVDDIELEMRPLAAFLGLRWSERLLDHRATASRRGFVPTPSYAQIQEPIYDRAIDRWLRYREQMEPVLPILRPWAEMMGYAA